MGKITLQEAGQLYRGKEKLFANSISKQRAGI
jgi:hypothetical protein